MLSPNVIIPFDGNHADIPSGFVRETTLDGKYPKGSANGVNPNVTGGASTHTHSSPSHSHTLPNHTHTYTTDQPQSPGDTDMSGTGTILIHGPHYHTGTTGSSSGGTTATKAVTYGSASNDPSYYAVIFIKATTYNFIPVNGLILKEAATRTGLSFHSASAGKFLKGAGTGANARSTGGGTTNTHSIDHTHSTNTHTHANSTTSFGSMPYGNVSDGSPNGDYSNLAHQHTTTTTAGTAGINILTQNLVGAETVEPAYRKINLFKNDGSSNVLSEIGDIAFWLGTLATIPIGWVICDGTNSTPDMRSKFLKINSTATTSSIGGSNTHTHAGASHNHTSPATHTHPSTTGYDISQSYRKVGDANQDWNLRTNHLHNFTTNATSATYNSSTTTANSSNNEPEYRTVVYIMFKFGVGGGSLFAMA